MRVNVKAVFVLLAPGSSLTGCSEVGTMSENTPTSPEGGTVSTAVAGSWTDTEIRVRSPRPQPGNPPVSKEK